MVYDCLMIEDEAPLAENTCKYLNLSGINAAAVSGVEGYNEFITYTLDEIKIRKYI